MHVHPWHLPRRKWLKRHVGRCQGNGGKESAKEFFQGSGAQENSKVFKLKTKVNKVARVFKFLNFEEQSLVHTVSAPRSNEGAVVEQCGGAGLEAESGGSKAFTRDYDAGLEAAFGNSVGSFDGAKPSAEFGGIEAEVEFKGSMHDKEEVEDMMLGRLQCAGHGEGGSGAVWAAENVQKGRVTDFQEMEVLGEEHMVAEASGIVGSVRGGKSDANSSDMVIMGHLHAHSPIVGSLGVGSACVGSSVGVRGAPGWSVGRWSARLSSSLCCPGCGLYGDGSLCMMCDTHGTRNSCVINSVQNLRLVRRPEHREETKLLKASSGIQVGFPVVDNVPGNASLVDYLRWAPKKWPVEGWECRTVLTPWVEKVKCFLAGGCEVVSTIMRVSEWYPVSTGPGEPLRTALGWTPLLRTPSSGVWLFRGAVRGEQLLAALVSSVDWVPRGTYRTAWAVEPRCLCSYAYGRRVAVGPHTGCRSWELLRDLWRAIAPHMAPWCAIGDVPTCANLNYYGGSGSCVRWHSDDEVLFGGRGESKLIVSVSVGFSALFRWKPRSCPDCEADSTWLHHGDLLVMDGRCQDEYLHSTDPRLDGERVNITFRWLKNHVPKCPLGTGVMCCLPTCVKGLPVPVYAGLKGLVWYSGWVLWFLLGMGLMLLAFLALVGLWHGKSRYFWVKLSFSLQGACLFLCHARETPGIHTGPGSGVLGFWEWFLGGFWGSGV